jgi:hypothetical protein
VPSVVEDAAVGPSAVVSVADAVGGAPAVVPVAESVDEVGCPLSGGGCELDAPWPYVKRSPAPAAESWTCRLNDARWGARSWGRISSPRGATEGGKGFVADRLALYTSSSSRNWATNPELVPVLLRNVSLSSRVVFSVQAGVFPCMTRMSASINPRRCVWVALSGIVKGTGIVPAAK